MSDIPLQVFEIDDGEQWHYVAPTAERALELFVSEMYDPMTVSEYKEQYPETVVTVCAPDKVLTIRFEADGSHEEDYKESKTCAAWACESDEGLLCSTVW